MKIEEKIEKKFYCPKCGIDLQLKANTKTKKRGRKLGTNGKLTEEDKQFIRNHQGHWTQCARDLNRPYSTVYNFAKREHL